MNSSWMPNDTCEVDPRISGIVEEEGERAGIGDGVTADFSAFDFDTGIGAEWLGSTGIPITFKTGSGPGSPVCRLEFEDEDEVEWEVRSARAGSDPESDFAFASRGRFKFRLVDGPGVPDFEPEVTGCGFAFLRLEFLDGGLVAVEDIVNSPT